MVNVIIAEGVCLNPAQGKKFFIGICSVSLIFISLRIVLKIVKCFFNTIKCMPKRILSCNI